MRKKNPASRRNGGMWNTCKDFHYKALLSYLLFLYTGILFIWSSTPVHSLFVIGRKICWRAHFSLICWLFNLLHTNLLVAILIKITQNLNGWKPKDILYDFIYLSIYVVMNFNLLLPRHFKNQKNRNTTHFISICCFEQADFTWTLIHVQRNPLEQL